MGLSIYKSDINTISDNINIINYKQKNIENVINTINDSVNTLKANCYGTTVSVMCFKLNNLKQQIESVNEYLTKYKQESQQVVDLYYQHCEGLNLDEDTLRNNISILNNKIDIYNNLSKPNKRLVNNATLQLERNQELLDGLYYVSNNTEGMMVSNDNLSTYNDKVGPTLDFVRKLFGIGKGFLKHLPIINSILVVVYDYNITLGEFSVEDTDNPGLQTRKFSKLLLYSVGDVVVSSLGSLAGGAVGCAVGGLIGAVSGIVFGSPGGDVGSLALGAIGLESGKAIGAIWGAYAADMFVNNYEINGKTISEHVHGFVDYCVDGFFDWIGL